MALLKKDYGYSNALWDVIIQKLKKIISIEYGVFPYISPQLNSKIGSPFRIWTNNQNTEPIFVGTWHKTYSFSINHYLKTENSEAFYKKIYQESERLYQLFFNNQGSTQKDASLEFFNGQPQGISITEVDDYFNIEIEYTCNVLRVDDFNYAAAYSQPSNISAVRRAIEPVLNFWSLDFDGTDDYIDAGSGSSIDNIFDGGGSVSLWFNPSAQSSTLGIIKKAHVGGWSFELADHSVGTFWRGKFVQTFDAGSHYQIQGSARTFSIGNWYNVVIVYNSSATSNTATIYVNGEVLSINTDSTPSSGTRYDDSSGNLIMGDTGIYEFSGQMSEVAIFSSALSSSEVSAMYSNGQPILLTENQGSYKSSGDLVAYYRMGSGSGDDRDTGTKNLGLVADQLDTSVGTDINNVTSWSVASGAGSDPLHSDFPNASTPNIEANTLYKIDLDVTSSNDSGYLQIAVNYSGETFSSFWQALPVPDDGEYRVYAYSGSNAGALFIRSGGGTKWTGTVSNISVKKIGGNGGILTNFDSLDFKTNVPQIYDNALFSNSLVFDGTDDYLDLGDKTTSLQSNGFTFSAWIYPNNFDAVQYLISSNADNRIYFSTNGYQLGLQVGGKGSTISSWSTDSDGVFVANEWQHLAVTYNDGVAKVYRNGNAVTFNTGGTTYTLPDGSMDGATEFKFRNIGKYYAVGSNWNGNISDMAIYNTDLDDTNITAIYNSGKPIDLTCDAGNYNNANNMVGYWKMGDGYLDELPSATNVGGILDQVVPILGDEIITNGNFTEGADGLDGWSNYGLEEGDSVTVNSDNQLVIVGNDKNDYAYQGNLIPGSDNGIYRLEIDIDSSSSGVYSHSFNGSLYPNEEGALPSGKNVFYFQWTNAGIAQLRLSGGITGGTETMNTFVINSVSLKKVNGNPGLCTNMNASAQSISVPE